MLAEDDDDTGIGVDTLFAAFVKRIKMADDSFQLISTIGIGIPFFHQAYVPNQVN